MNKDPKNNSDEQADPFGFLSQNEENGLEQDGINVGVEENDTIEDSGNIDDGAGEKEKTVEEINPFKSLKNLTLYAIANSEKYRNLMGMTMGDEDREKDREKSDFYVKLAEEEIRRREEAGEFYPEKDVDIQADFNEKFYVSNGNPRVKSYSWGLGYQERDATYEEVMNARKGNRPEGYLVDETAGNIYLRDENGKLTQVNVEDAFYKALVSGENIDHANEMIENSFFDKEFKAHLKSVADYAREGIDDTKMNDFSGYVEMLREGADKRQYEICKKQVRENLDNAEKVAEESGMSEKYKEKLTNYVDKKRYERALDKIKENLDDAEKIIAEAKISSYKFRDALGRYTEEKRVSSDVDEERYKVCEAQIRENPDDAEKIIAEAKISDHRKYQLWDMTDKLRYEICDSQIEENLDDAEKIIAEAKISERWKDILRRNTEYNRVKVCEAQILENPDDAEKIIVEAKIGKEMKYRLRMVDGRMNELREQGYQARIRENLDDAEKIIEEANAPDWMKDRLKEYADKEREKNCEAQIWEDFDNAEAIINGANVSDYGKDRLREKVFEIARSKYIESYKNGNNEECERIDKKFGIIDNTLLRGLRRGDFYIKDGKLDIKRYSYNADLGDEVLKRAEEQLEKEKNEFVGIFEKLSPEEKEKLAEEFAISCVSDRGTLSKLRGLPYESEDALESIMERIRSENPEMADRWTLLGETICDAKDEMIDGRMFDVFYRKAGSKDLTEFFRSEIFKDKDNAYFAEKGMDWLRDNLVEILANGAREGETGTLPYFIFETEAYEKYKDEIGIDFDDPKIFDLCLEGWKETIGKTNGQFSKAQKWYFEQVFSRDFGRFKEYTDILKNVTYEGLPGKKKKLTQAIKELEHSEIYINAQQELLKQNESEEGRLMMKDVTYEDMVKAMTEYEMTEKEAINMFRTGSVYRGKRERTGEKVEEKKLPHYGYFKAKEMMNLFQYVLLNFDWPGKETETEEERKNNPHAPHLYYQQFGGEKKELTKEITLNDFLDEPSFFIGFTFEYDGKACAIFDNLGCRKGGGRFVMKDETGDGVEGLLVNFENSREEVRKRGEIEGDAIRLNHMADVNGYQIMEPLRDLNVRTLYWLKYGRKYDAGSAKQKYGASYPTLEDAANRRGEVLQNEEYGNSVDDLRNGESGQEYADRVEEMRRRAEELSHDERQQMLEDTFI